jgi:hypothetical protein
LAGLSPTPLTPSAGASSMYVARTAPVPRPARPPAHRDQGAVLHRAVPNSLPLSLCTHATPCVAFPPMVPRGIRIRDHPDSKNQIEEDGGG